VIREKRSDGGHWAHSKKTTKRDKRGLLTGIQTKEKTKHTNESRTRAILPSVEPQSCQKKIQSGLRKTPFTICKSLLVQSLPQFCQQITNEPARVGAKWPGPKRRSARLKERRGVLVQISPICGRVHRSSKKTVEKSTEKKVRDPEKGQYGKKIFGVGRLGFGKKGQTRKTSKRKNNT